MKKIKILKNSWYIDLMVEVNQLLEELGDNVTDIQYQTGNDNSRGLVHSVMVVYED